MSFGPMVFTKVASFHHDGLKCLCTLCFTSVSVIMLDSMSFFKDDLIGFLEGMYVCLEILLLLEEVLGGPYFELL